MKNRIALICLLVALTTSVASADTWNTSLWSTIGDPPVVVTTKWIDVVTTATDMGSFWHWDYALTPQNVNNIRALTITLGNPEATMVTNVVGPANWSVGIESGGAVYWQTTGNGDYTLDFSQGETFTYGYDHPWGPTEVHAAAALNGSGYSGPVPGPSPVPSVPEPASVLALMTGLASLAGLSRQRRK